MHDHKSGLPEATPRQTYAPRYHKRVALSTSSPTTLTPRPTPVSFRQARVYLQCLSAFTAIGLVYSLTTWGMVPVWQRVPVVNVGLMAHLTGHLVFGAMVAVSLRRFDLIALTAAMSMLVDIDHVGTVLGWPTVFRSGHSVGFALAAPLLMAWLATRVDFGVRPITAGCLALAATLAHISWDTLTAPGVPLWLPVSVDVTPLSLPWAVALEVAGVVAVWVAAAAERRQKPVCAG